MAEQVAASAADESDFSTSSVDQFLRDHGFDIADHAGLELSSLSDDDDDDDASNLSEQLQQQPQQAQAGDDEGATRTPSRLRVVTNVSPDDDDAEGEEKEIVDDAPLRRSERRRRRHSLFDAQSASEEEEPVTPRFTLLNDKDLLLVQGEQTTSTSAVTPIAEMQADDSYHAHEGQGHDDDEAGHDSDGRDSLDRSMVLGVGSGFSGFSSSGVDERSRIAQILHEKGASPVVSIQRSREQQQQCRSNSLSSSPSIIPGSSVGSLASGSRRVQDDELSDALGVTSSTPEQDPSIITRAAISSRLSRASVHQRRATFTTNRPSAVRASQRALFAAEDEERKESENVRTRESFQSNQQRPSVTLSEPYIQRGSIPSRADESRVRASSVPSADDGGWGDLNDKLRRHGLQVVTFERIHAADGIAMTVPNRASVFDCVQDVVLQLERKDQVRLSWVLIACRGDMEIGS